MNPRILALALPFVFAATARADIPLPKNIQYIDPQMQFKDLDKHADYVFYLRFLTFSGGPSGVPYRLVEVKDDKAFAMGAQRRLSDVSLLAMKRDEFDKRVKDKGAAAFWLNDKTPDVLRVSVPTPATTAKVGQTPPVNAFRVSIQNGKLAVEQLPQKDRRQSDATPDDRRSPFLATGVCLALGFTSFGLWFARRRSSASQSN